MTTATFSVAPDLTTDATFRAWGSTLSAALATVGMVKTADTGQIDWATVVKPSGSNAFMGYEVWRFNDALQSTAPIFLKVEFGSGGVATRPAIKFTSGKSSNGAGVIGGAFGAAVQMSANGNSATPYNCYVASRDGSLLALSMWPASGFPVHFFIERSRDASGVATGWAVDLSSAATQLASYVYSSATVFQTGTPPTPLPLNAASTTVAGVAPMFPMLCMDGQGHYWQSRAALQYNANDAAVAVPVTVAGWGTYLPVSWTGFPQSGTNLAIAWS